MGTIIRRVTLNEGIELAKGEYIARMDGDDICIHNRIEKQVQYMKQHPDIDILGSFIDIIDEEGNIIGEETFFQTHEDILKFSLRMRIDLQHPTILAKANVLKDNRYKKEYDNAEDYELFTRLVEQYKCCNIPEKLLLYRRHAHSISTEKRNEQRRKACMIAEKTALRRGLLNRKEVLYDLDWHNKCFYMNYAEQLEDKSVIIYASDYYLEWIEDILIKISNCICKGVICDNVSLKRLIDINNDEEADFIMLATLKWWQCKQYLLNNGVDNDRIIYAFYCRKQKDIESNEYCGL